MSHPLFSVYFELFSDRVLVIVVDDYSGYVRTAEVGRNAQHFSEDLSREISTMLQFIVIEFYLRHERIRKRTKGADVRDLTKGAENVPDAIIENRQIPRQSVDVFNRLTRNLLKTSTTRGRGIYTYVTYI